MKTKSIYIALACLPITCGISNAMDSFNRLAITDGTSAGQLTPYTGMAVTTTNSQTLSMSDYTTFKGDVFGGYTETGTKFVEVGQTPKGMIMVQVQAGYKGYDPQEMVILQNNIKYLLANPGIVLGAKFDMPKEIKLTQEDTINMQNLSNFLLDTFFEYSMNSEIIISSEHFKKFAGSDGHPHKNCEYKFNPIVYAFMYYFDDPEAETVAIKHKYKSYNNLKFEFSTYSGEDGLDLDFKFDPNDSRLSIYNMSSKVHLLSDTTNTLTKRMGSGFNVVDASFKFGLYKVSEAVYRMNLVFAAKDFDFSTEYKVHKLQNIKVKATK